MSFFCIFHPRILASVVLILGLLTPCVAPAKEVTVTLYAATSCWVALEKIRKAYTKKHPDVAIVIAYGASGDLARQITIGAPGDITITANTHWTKWLQEKNHLLAQEPFVANRLALITYRGSSYASMNTKKGDISLKESMIQILSTFGGRFALANPALSPVGDYGRQVLEALGVWQQLQEHILWGQDAGNILAWMRLEVAELGIVYRTDIEVLTNGHLLMLIPETLHRPVVYHIGLLKKASPQGRAFYAFLQEHGKHMFFKAGFLPIKNHHDNE